MCSTLASWWILCFVQKKSYKNLLLTIKSIKNQAPSLQSLWSHPPVFCLTNSTHALILNKFLHLPSAHLKSSAWSTFLRPHFYSAPRVQACVWLVQFVCVCAHVCVGGCTCVVVCVCVCVWVRVHACVCVHACTYLCWKLCERCWMMCCNVFR